MQELERTILLVSFEAWRRRRISSSSPESHYGSRGRS